MSVKSQSLDTKVYPDSFQIHTPQKHQRLRRHSLVAWSVLVILSLAAASLLVLVSPFGSTSAKPLPNFYASVRTPHGICDGVSGNAVSHSGFIGLEGDSEDKPRRSFFWLFEAEKNPESAPVILAIGGGPGTSGMSNPLLAQSHCTITAEGPVPNPHAWSEKVHILALDHPIGVGYSHGAMVNNSRAAAVDVYDFLQKFYHIYPHLIKNEFMIASGSYGGTYVPHIATVIHEQNQALAAGKGQPGAVHINLESLIISNPISDAMSHFRWWLHHACHNTHIYNSTTCDSFYALQPTCMELIQFAYQWPTVENKVRALNSCAPLMEGDTHGTMLENVDKQCNGTVEDCHPTFGWISNFMNDERTKEELGVPPGLKFEVLNYAVWGEFMKTGDYIQPTYLLYEPLLRDGIRLLHYIGAKDANCGYPGILSFLKLLPSQYQDRFINTPDVPWLHPGPEDPTTSKPQPQPQPQPHPQPQPQATVRVVGDGAGDMTYILIAKAGHFVASDQPALAKRILEHWIDKRPFF